MPKEAAPKVTSVQQKKQRSSTKAGDIDRKELTDFLTGLFGVLGATAGVHWFITEDEADSIAKPLATILNKMNKKKKDNINGYMAPMLLLAAIGTVVVPRMMTQTQLMKGRKNHVRKPAESRSHPGEASSAGGQAAPQPAEPAPIGAEGKAVDAGEDGTYIHTSVPTSISRLFADSD